LYESREGTAQITSDTIITVLLLQTHANIRIRLREDTRPLTNAIVTLEEDTLMSNSLGDALFSTLPVSESYYYTVNKEGYDELTGDIQLTGDTTVQLQMTKVEVTADKGAHEEIFRIWPNPADEYISFTMPADNKIIEVQITGLNGGIVKRTSFEMQPRQINIKDMAPGIYIIRVTCKEAVYKALFSKQ
jgi:hypothetical protein